VESEVVAMVIFVFTEVMLFGAFLSAYTIISSSTSNGVWPPPTDPALPVAATGVATVALTLSGLAVFIAGRAQANALGWLRIAAGLATSFVVWQLVEFSRLVREGLTLQSSAHGGFFYTIVGLHALHAVVAILVLLWSIGRLRTQRMSPALFRAVRIFWYFVVGLWPVLYARVYL
jgi:cytochrome c oxidase subunit 3